MHTGGKLCGNILIAQVRKVAVVKGYVLHVAILSSAHPGHARGKRVNATEINISDGGTKVILLDLNADGMLIIAVDGNIGKADILDQRRLKALVAHARLGGIGGQIHTKSGSGFGNVEVGEGAVSHHAVVDPSHTNRAGVTCQVAVGNGNLLTDRVLPQGCRIGTNGNAIVSAGDVAIRDRHVATAVDVESVVVGHIHGGKDLRSVEMHVGAAADPVAPAGRLIAHGHVLHQKICASKQHDHTGGGETGGAGIQGMGISTDHHNLPQRLTSLGQGEGLARIGHGGARGDLLLGHGLHIGMSLTIDDTSSRDGDILTVLGINKASFVEARRIFGIPEVGHHLGKIAHVGRAQQYRVPFQMQLHSAFQIDPSAQKASLCKGDPSASVSRTIVDGGLHRRSILGHTVSHGTVGSYVTIQHSNSLSFSMVIKE